MAGPRFRYVGRHRAWTRAYMPPARCVDGSAGLRHHPPTIGFVTKNAHMLPVILAGAGLLSGGMATLAAAQWLFSFSLDTHSRFSMMKRLSTGKVGPAADYLDITHADADDEARAARWFAEGRTDAQITSEDGLRLHAWLMGPDASHAGGAAPYAEDSHLWAICCHGYSGGPDEMAKYAMHLASKGFHTLLPAMRAHELSEGRYIGMGWLERRDLIGWIRWIVERDPEASILLMGVSMGASTVMMTVGERDLPENVAAAIEDCGYPCVWDEFMDNARSLYHVPAAAAKPVVAVMSAICKVRAGYGFRQASALPSLGRAHVPMLFIHGGADTFVPTRFLAVNYEACASDDKECLEIPGAVHAMSASTDPKRYWDAVDAFVDRAMPGDGV